MLRKAIHLDDFEGSSVAGSEGGIRLRPFGFYQTVGDMDMDGKINTKAARFRWENVDGERDIYDSPQHHWIAAHQGRVELLPLARIALNTMLISEGIYLSAKLGREVTAQEVREMSKSTALTGDDVYRDDNELLAEMCK